MLGIGRLRMGISGAYSASYVSGKPYFPRVGDVVFVVKGGGIQSALVKGVSPTGVYLQHLHERGKDFVKASDLIPRIQIRREEPMATKSKTKTKKKSDDEDDDDDEDTKSTKDDDDDDDDEDDDDTPKKGKKASKSDDDDDDDEDDDDDKPAKKKSKSDDDDDDDEDEDEKPKKKKSSKDDDDDEDEDDDDDKGKKGKKKKKAGRPRGPKEVDTSESFGREGTKRRFLFDALVEGGEPDEIIKTAKKAHKSADRKAEGLDKYDNIGASAIRSFHKMLVERGYEDKSKGDELRIGLSKGSKKKK